jgi:hypothetical protein
VELGKACRREAAARKLGGERCVLILSLTCLWRGEVCEQCRICNKEYLLKHVTCYCSDSNIYEALMFRAYC